MQQRKKEASTGGEIQFDAIYTLEEVKARLGIEEHAMRKARRAGLKVHRVGRKGFLLGDELAEFIRAAKIAPCVFKKRQTV